MKLIDDNMIEDLAVSLGLEFLPKGKREEVLTEITKLISKRAGAKVMENFSEEEIRDFNKIPDDDLGQMEDFLLAKNSEAKNIFNEEAKRTKEEILSMRV